MNTLIEFMRKRGFVEVVKKYYTDNHDPRPGCRRVWERAVIKHKDGHVRRIFLSPNGWRFS